MPYLKGKQSVLIRKHFEDRESWLEGRQELGIGGSDAAAVCGLSPWTSPVELWKIKTGQKKPKRTKFFTDSSRIANNSSWKMMDTLEEKTMPNG